MSAGRETGVTDGSAAFRPMPLLRDSRIQSALGTLKFRRLFIRSRKFPASHPTLLECGGGVRLLALHDPARGPAGDRPHVVVLFHGWEGGATSTYLESIRPGLLAEGYEVYRLNFRDHGGTQTLNRDLFHSCRIGEVVDAVERIAERHPGSLLSVVGYSLGGNFALRVGLRAPDRGVPLARIVAINPVIVPAHVLNAIETANPLFHRHFVRKWRRSVRLKRRAFPGTYDIDAWLRIDSLREQTRDLIVRYTEFESLETYLDGYSIGGNRLVELRSAAVIVTAEDDPIIPIEDIRALERPPTLALDIQRFGGHCGFIEDLRLRAWIDGRVRAHLRQDTYS